MSYLGDYPVSGVVYGSFTTYRPSTGAPYALAGTPILQVYKNDSATQWTTDISVANGTLSNPDSVAGTYLWKIDTSADGTFFAAGGEFHVVITTGTVDSVSAVGTVVGRFSIERAGGALALLKNATYGLSALETIVDDLEGRLTAARAGYLDNINNAALQTTAAQTGDAYTIVNHADYGNAKLVRSTTPANTLAVDAGGKVAVPNTQKVDVDTIKTRTVVATSTITFQNGTIPITTDLVAASAVADAVWDEAIAGHLGAGSTGAALNAAGSAGDPWVTPIPGAYGAGTAGYILGTNIDATISSRGTGTALDAAGVRAAVGMSSANLDTQLAAIVEDTGTTLPATLSGISGRIPAALSSGGNIKSDVKEVNDVTLGGTGVLGDEWGPA